jgi:transcriptional regulator with XRE-family HTH domain
MFAEKVRALMKSKGMSQVELASRIGTRQQVVSRWLDKDKPPKARYLARIAVELGVSVDYLLDDGQAKFRPVLDPEEAKILDLAREIGYQVARRRLLRMDDADYRPSAQDEPKRDAKQGRDSDPEQPPGRKDQAG